jgi:hypothetical protein
MSARICNQTKETMYEGWVLCDDIYLKYQKDVDGYLLEWAKYDGLDYDSIEDLRDHYFEEGMYYWTTWYEDED